ncbi:unnamed protein product [Urochloa humidicola]
MAMVVRRAVKRARRPGPTRPERRSAASGGARWMQAASRAACGVCGRARRPRVAPRELVGAARLPRCCRRAGPAEVAAGGHVEGRLRGGLVVGAVTWWSRRLGRASGPPLQHQRRRVLHPLGPASFLRLRALPSLRRLSSWFPFLTGKTAQAAVPFATSSLSHLPATRTHQIQYLFFTEGTQDLLNARVDIVQYSALESERKSSIIQDDF